MNTMCTEDIPGGNSADFSADLKKYALCADFTEADIWGRMDSRGREIVISIQLNCLSRSIDCNEDPDFVNLLKIARRP